MPPNHYVNNKEFHQLLITHKELLDREKILLKKSVPGIELLRVQRKIQKVRDKLGVIYLAICTNMLHKGNFSNYTRDRKDEMVSDACFFMSKYTSVFNVEKKNPFAYFTTICKNAFVQNINKWSNYSEKYQSLSYLETIHLQNNTNEDDWG